MRIEERARALFENYAAAKTNEARAAYVFAHPPLLANATLATIRAALVDADGSQPLSELASIRAQLEAGQGFPLGNGPIEVAWQAQMRGENSAERARVNASDCEAIEPLTYPYAKALSQYAYGLARNDARGALALQTLLLAACEAAQPDAECCLARVRASMDYLFIAVPSLVDVPDGRIYRRALELGTWLETRPERTTLWPPGELDFALGVLNLDPYVLGGDVVNYARSYAAWQYRLVAALGTDAAAIPPQTLAMPAPLDALTLAIAHLVKAVATQTGDAIATAQKALGQAIALRAALKGTSLTDSAPPQAAAPDESSGDVGTRQARWNEELASIANAQTPCAANGEDDSPAALVRDLAAAQRERRESELLARLDRLAISHSAELDAHAEAFEYVRYLLVQGIAANAFAESNWQDSITYDGLALSYCLQHDAADDALIFASRIDDVASNDGVGAAVATVMVACALRLEAVLGERGLRLIRSIVSKTVTGLLHAGEINVNVYATLMLATTGTRLDSFLRADARIRSDDDPEANVLRAQIAELERTSGPSLEALDGEEVVLASFVESSTIEDGASPGERLRNLERVYDARFDARLAASGVAQRPAPLTLGELRASLDDRTVVLHYYLGRSPDGRIATIVMLVTNDDAAITAIVEPGHIDLVGIDLAGGVRAWMPPLGFAVQERRAQVRAEPGPRLVDRDGGDGLTNDLRRFLGPFVERLDDVRARGKTRLCIVPYGPLHFYPWALLGGPTAPLGATWQILVAPTLGYIAPRAAASGIAAKSETTVVGLSFTTPGRFGLAPIPLSATEANAVAAAVGTTPLLEDAATKSAVLAALRRSRRAHVSTHGRHAVFAAAFSSLFCADDGTLDAGRIRAYEIAEQDLRGCELVTLSACETALGRYDLGDNVRGLAAAFFLAGVETLVATLWSVNSAATATFFPAFYTALERGAEIGDAFATAQTATRAAHPKLRDWGGFYLMGRPC